MPTLRGARDLFTKTPTATAQLVRPTLSAEYSHRSLLSATPFLDETLHKLEGTDIPLNDLRELAHRLEGKPAIPLVVESRPPQLQIGAKKEFWVSNADSNQYSRVPATLQFITEHAYFWIEDGLKFDSKDLERLAHTFEYHIYPTNRRYFGSEWTPGVDGDPHIYILYTQDLGVSLAGYFSSSDEQHPLSHPFSNAHEMFVLNADNLDLAEEYTLSVLAHEFQHMIHWHQDRDETSWINEGLSELAIFLNGMIPGSDYSYIRDTDIQLNDWPDDESAKRPHYGAAFLFLAYFYDRFGPEALRALVAQPENGFEGIDRVLEGIFLSETSAEQQMTAENLFLDWAITLYLQDGAVGDGRYAYRNYQDAPRASVTETIDTCPQPGFTREVSQFGIDYLRITCPGDHRLFFEGSTVAKVVPADPYSGDYAFWSNRGDESDMTLTKYFDFSGHEGVLTLAYQTWYDLERDYDYVYVEASENGENWKILKTPSGTLEDPTGNSFGWGYNGSSGGWIEERVDLSEFAGKKVWIRFEYVTDAAVTGEGMLLDDIAIPEMGYSADFEADDGGWLAEGWVRIRNLLPQKYLLALLTFGEKVEVDVLLLPPDNIIEIPLKLYEGRDEAVLVVAGATQFTRQKAAYRLEIQP